MIGIVIVAHGALAREFLAATIHVVGAQTHVKTVRIDADHDRAEKQQEICMAVDTVDQGAGVVVVTDLHGGSPCNLSFKACEAQNRRIITGANLPLLIKLAKSRNKPIADAVDAAVEAGRKYIGSQPSGAGV